MEVTQYRPELLTPLSSKPLEVSLNNEITVEFYDHSSCNYFRSLRAQDVIFIPDDTGSVKFFINGFEWSATVKNHGNTYPPVRALTTTIPSIFEVYTRGTSSSRLCSLIIELGIGEGYGHVGYIQYKDDEIQKLPTSLSELLLTPPPYQAQKDPETQNTVIKSKHAKRSIFDRLLGNKGTPSRKPSAAGPTARPKSSSAPNSPDEIQNYQRYGTIFESVELPAKSSHPVELPAGQNSSFHNQTQNQRPGKPIVLTLPNTSHTRSKSDASAKARNLNGGPQVRALYRFVPQVSDELAFEEGDIITLLGGIPGLSEWRRGSLNGRVGVFPWYYVEAFLKNPGRHQEKVEPSADMDARMRRERADFEQKVASPATAVNEQNTSPKTPLLNQETPPIQSAPKLEAPARNKEVSNSTTQLHKPPIEYVKALLDCLNTQSHYSQNQFLTFRKGDIIAVVDRGRGVGDYWWTGVRKTSVGMFMRSSTTSLLVVSTPKFDEFGLMKPLRALYAYSELTTFTAVVKHEAGDILEGYEHKPNTVWAATLQNSAENFLVRTSKTGLWLCRELSDASNHSDDIYNASYQDLFSYRPWTGTSNLDETVDGVMKVQEPAAELKSEAQKYEHELIMRPLAPKAGRKRELVKESYIEDLIQLNDGDQTFNAASNPKNSKTDQPPQVNAARHPRFLKLGSIPQTNIAREAMLITAESSTARGIEGLISAQTTELAAAPRQHGEPPLMGDTIMNEQALRPKLANVSTLVEPDSSTIQKVEDSENQDTDILALGKSNQTHNSDLEPPTVDSSTNLNRQNRLQLLAMRERRVNKYAIREHEHRKYDNEKSIPFQHVARLGSGAFGIVDAVKITEGSARGTHFARKIIKLSMFKCQEEVSTIQNEVAVLKGLLHEHIAQIVTSYDYLRKREFGLIMYPLADMDLSEYLLSLDEESALVIARKHERLRSWLGCLIDALDYMHEKKVQHKDIKPANLIIRGDQIYITDFGLAKTLQDESATATTWSSGGSPMYLPPEALDLDSPDHRRGRSGDVFAMGCVFLEIATALAGESLGNFYGHRETNGVCAYAKVMPKTLRWIHDVMCELHSNTYPWPMPHITIQAMTLGFLMINPNAAKRMKSNQLVDVVTGMSTDDKLDIIDICCFACRSRFIDADKDYEHRLNTAYFKSTNAKIEISESWEECYLSWFEEGDPTTPTVAKP